MLNSITKNKNLQQFVSDIARDMFEVFTVFYLILLLINQIKIGFVSDFINLNHILIIVALSGLLSLWKENLIAAKRDYIFITILAFIGAITMYYKTSTFGNIEAFIFSILTFIFIVLVLFFLLRR